MPGIRQVGDFIAAIYSPYTTYGVDEVSRYDTFYGDYGVDNRRHSPQYRNVRWDIGISLIYGFGSWRILSYQHSTVTTSWPYFGVKLRKKLPIVTLR